MDGNILLIEDDGDIRESIHMLLKGEGYNVEEAETGIAGLRYIRDDFHTIEAGNTVYKNRK